MWGAARWSLFREALASPSIGYKSDSLVPKKRPGKRPNIGQGARRLTLEPDVHLTSPGRPSLSPHSWGGLLGKQRKKTYV